MATVQPARHQSSLPLRDDRLAPGLQPSLPNDSKRLHFLLSCPLRVIGHIARCLHARAGSTLDQSFSAKLSSVMIIDVSNAFSVPPNLARFTALTDVSFFHSISYRICCSAVIRLARPQRPPSLAVAQLPLRGPSSLIGPSSAPPQSAAAQGYFGRRI